MKVTGSESEDGFSGVTIPLTQPGSKQTAQECISYSRTHYAMPKEVVEERLFLLFGDNHKDKPKLSSKIVTKKVEKKSKFFSKIAI